MAIGHYAGVPPRAPSIDIQDPAARPATGQSAGVAAIALLAIGALLGVLMLAAYAFDASADECAAGESDGACCVRLAADDFSAGQCRRTSP
jgi:hypothetical protein